LGDSFAAKSLVVLPQPLKLALMVEGDGDAAALPIVVRRIAITHFPGLLIQFPNPYRMVPNLFTKEVSSVLNDRAHFTGKNGGILVLFDSDDDLPCSAKQQALRQQVLQARPDVPTRMVFAHREFETWFIASAQSLRGQFGLSEDFAIPKGGPESKRGAKEWLHQHMADGYVETVHQKELARLFSLAEARVVPSFAKLERDVIGLITTLLAL
jgi:hypothetical protein